MKKLLIILFLFSVQTGFGQNENIQILNATDQALEKWAPGYNRRHGTPTVECMDTEKLSQSIHRRAIENYKRLAAGDNYNNWNEEMLSRNKKSLEWVGQVLDGKKFYIVTYGYNKEYEIFSNGYAAQVFIWANNHTVFQIGLGDGPVLPNLDDPQYQTPSKRVVPYTPRLIKDESNPERFINEQGQEVIRVII